MTRAAPHRSLAADERCGSFAAGQFRASADQCPVCPESEATAASSAGSSVIDIAKSQPPDTKPEKPARTNPDDTSTEPSSSWKSRARVLSDSAIAQHMVPLARGQFSNCGRRVKPFLVSSAPELGHRAAIWGDELERPPIEAASDVRRITLLRYCGVPSTAKARNVAYFSPTFRASLNSGVLRAARAFSRLSQT